MTKARRARIVVASTLGVIVLFLGCLRITWGEPVNSDAAGNALEAWAMLHGNWLLHGWVVTDVSFYTTELPEYAIAEVIRGLRPDVMHICAALTYTLIVLGAALIARGGRRGRAGQTGAGLAGAGLAAAIILIPQPGQPTDMLMSTPDHTGTTVPVLATFVLLDRAPRRCWVPMLTGLLLAWSLVADELVLLIGVVPLVLVYGARFVAGLARGVSEGSPGWLSAWFEGAVAAAAVISVGLAFTADRLIRAYGGFSTQPVGTQLVHAGALPRNIGLTAEGVLALFGANFIGLPLGLNFFLAVLHLAGVALVAVALGVTLRHWLDSADLIAVVLATGIVVNVGVYLATYTITSVTTTREIAPVMGLGAALAGRVVAGSLMAAGSLARARRERLTVAGMAGYLVMAVITVAVATPVPITTTPPAPLVTWLGNHGLRTGLAGYWETSGVVLQSRGRIQMGMLVENQAGLLAPRRWEDDMRWFNARAHDPTFVVTIASGKPPSYITEAEALRTFGSPVRTLRFEGLIILDYNRNLLNTLMSS